MRSSINQLLCVVEFLAKIWIGEGIVTNEIDLAPKQCFKFMKEIKENVCPVQAFPVDAVRVKVD